MNATENPAVQSYLKKVSSLLECPRQRKKEILRGIELLIGEQSVLRKKWWRLTSGRRTPSS